MAAQNPRKKDEKGSDIMKPEGHNVLIETEFHKGQMEFEAETLSKLEEVQREEPGRMSRSPSNPPKTGVDESDTGICPHGPSADCECDRSRGSLCSTGKYNHTKFSSTERLSPYRQDDPEDDCASVILTCLFCRFYDFFLMLPGVCEGAVAHRCPSRKRLSNSVEHLHANDDCSCDLECDCSLLDACHDTSECLELAMEVSEICYR